MKKHQFYLWLIALAGLITSCSQDKTDMPVAGESKDVYKRQGARWAYDKLYNDFFYHRHNEFWKQEAMRKLPPLISSTRMLVCGEDLGMIPHCVPEVMKTLQILSLEIQRMPKYTEYELGDIWHYPCLLSTSRCV